MGTSLLLGSLIGLVMGLTGAGGGILAVPVLVFAFHLPITEAGPIALLAAAIAAAVASSVGLRQGIVRYRAAMLVAVTGMLAAPFGLLLAHRVDTRLLTLAFAGVMVLVGVRNLRDARHRMAVREAPAELPCVRSPEDGRFIWTSACAQRLSAVGALTGFLSGLLGVGGGFVIVPALQRYTDLTMQSVIATSIAITGLISITGVTTSLLHGGFNLQIGMPFAAGAVLGLLVGGRLASRFQAHHLKQAFGAVCLLVAVGLLLRLVLTH